MDCTGRIITVIGMGLIGGSICSGLKNKGVYVKGMSSPGSIEKAQKMGIIDRGFDYSNIEEAVRGSDTVFICTPLFDIIKRIPEVFEHVERSTVVTDVGSTKKAICGTAERSIRRGTYFIGGHPMAGSEKRGVENANPFLFYDAVWVLTPIKGTSRGVVRRLSSLLDLLGAKVMIIPPDLHDRIAASVSHLPQLLAVSLVNHLASKKSEIYRGLAAGGFRDMTRIAASDYSMWRDIIKMNRDEIEEALRDFHKRIGELIENLDDESYLQDAFFNARRERETIPKYTKGFLKPLIDVRVSVRDRPGELGKITNTIYYHGINIKDIEIINVREGEGGVLRLGFTEEKEASHAAQALRDIGYEASVID
ncbi:MAG: prephenate dehydrogenase/arogenate dehydrogenase family protein [Spirochaetota bacterium]